MAKKQQVKRNIYYGDIFNSDAILYYQTHIIEFVYDCIFLNRPEYSLTNQQKDFLLVVQNNNRVAAKSGKGCGKTSGISFAVIWFLCCFDNPKIVCTAPTYPTLKAALWPEISKWLNISVVKDIFTHTEDRLYLTEAPKLWWCEPRTAKDAESMQGLHADNLLLIADEASGLKLDIHEALDTTLTGRNNKYILIGNPTQVSGPFFDAFNSKLSKKKWTNRTYSSIDSPIVSREQISYYEEKYGKHHDLYLVNILGEFPTGSPDAFIKLTDVHAAVNRSSDIIPYGDIEIGIDVARFGDDLTVLYWRHGYKVYPAKTLAKSSIVDCQNLVLETVTEIRKKNGYNKTIRVKVDDGGVGGGLVDLLKLNRSHNIDVIPCNFGGAGNDTYQNEASIMWANLKNELSYIGLPEDTHLINELSSRRWRMSPSGKIMLEPKSEYKKNFKSSPDRADALVLCFARKTNEKNIIKEFDCLDKNVIVPKIDYLSNDKMASIFYSKDLFVSIIYTAWDGRKLYIFDEYVGEQSIPYITLNIQQHYPLLRIIGNEAMFGDVKDDLYSKYRKYKVRISENYNFNELSAIDTLNTLVKMKRLVISSNCKNVIEQMREWNMNVSKIDQERKFGLCLALCNTVSDLRKKINATNQVIEVKPSYGDFKELEKTKNDEDSWMSLT